MSATLNNLNGLEEPVTKRGRSTPEPVTARGESFVPGKTTELYGGPTMKPLRSDKALQAGSCTFPFNKDAMSRYLDVENCSWAQLGWGSTVGQAIRKHSLKEGRTIFKSSAFKASTWARQFPGWPEEEDFGGNTSDSDDDSDDGKKYEPKGPHSELSLGFGVHETTHTGEKLWVLLQQNTEKPFAFDGRRGWQSNREIFVFVNGKSRADFISSWLEEMISLIPISIPKKPTRREFKIYRWSHCNAYWRKTQKQKARKMDSVILPEGVIEKVQADMEEFLAPDTAEWYTTFGIPYKRSYLFHGIPGSGKTSLICALAGKLKRNVCFLAAHHPAFSDDAMKSAMEGLPDNSFLIMEDIDSLFVKRKSQSSKSSLTFTGLLNCLDGIGFAKGQIVIMTTNYVDRLDEALIRAGRADMWVEFKKATDFQLAGLFKWFYHNTPEEAEKWADVFVKGVREKFKRGVTMCELQQHFVDHRKNDPKTCAEGISDYDMPLRKFKHLKSLDFEENKFDANSKPVKEHNLFGGDDSSETST